MQTQQPLDALLALLHNLPHDLACSCLGFGHRFGFGLGLLGLPGCLLCLLFSRSLQLIDELVEPRLLEFDARWGTPPLVSCVSETPLDKSRGPEATFPTVRHSLVLQLDMHVGVVSRALGMQYHVQVIPSPEKPTLLLASDKIFLAEHTRVACGLGDLVKIIRRASTALAAWGGLVKITRTSSPRLLSLPRLPCSTTLREGPAPRAKQLQIPNLDVR